MNVLSGSKDILQSYIDYYKCARKIFCVGIGLKILTRVFFDLEFCELFRRGKYMLS